MTEDEQAAAYGQDDTQAIGVYGDDPLGITARDPAPANYHRYERPQQVCTCPPPSRWALAVRHDTDPFDDPEHQCAPPRQPRPGIDWAEVFTGYRPWTRRR